MPSRRECSLEESQCKFVFFGQEKCGVTATIKERKMRGRKGTGSHQEAVGSGGGNGVGVAMIAHAMRVSPLRHQFGAGMPSAGGGDCRHKLLRTVVGS
jgi:hypothetical protein